MHKLLHLGIHLFQLDQGIAQGSPLFALVHKKVQTVRFPEFRCRRVNDHGPARGRS